MATYTEIDVIVPQSGGSPDTSSAEYKTKQSQFYLQGFPVYLDIQPPTDKTVASTYSFTYTCDIEASPISSYKDSNNVVHYRYNNSFKPKATNVTLTKATTSGYTNYWTTNIPQVECDSAFRFTVYVNDDYSGKVVYSNKVIVYAYYYGTLIPKLNSAGWENNALSIQYQFTMTGPRLESGPQTYDYHYWYDYGMLNGWSTYFTDIFISTSKLTLSELPSDAPYPTIRGVIGVSQSAFPNCFFQNGTTNNVSSGQTLVFTPYYSGGSITNYDPYNVKVSFDTDNSNLIVEVKGLTYYYKNGTSASVKALNQSTSYYLYIQVYNNTTSKNGKAYLGTTLTTRITPPTPIMQMREHTITVTRLKDCTENAPLIVDNSTTDASLVDTISLYKSGSKVGYGTNADNIPSIGFYNGSNKYFILYLSADEATAWSTLISS